jgi:hypothetical protein
MNIGVEIALLDSLSPITATFRDLHGTHSRDLFHFIIGKSILYSYLHTRHQVVTV